MRSVSGVLDKLGPSPCEFLLNSSQDSLLSLFAQFKHRFTTGSELVEMLLGAARVVRRYGSLHQCFAAGLKEEHETVLPAACAFVEKLAPWQGENRSSLIPSPSRGSACKRLNLFLRWMVRADEVDPGGWDQVPASKLVVPVDTHIHRIGLFLGFTNNKCANINCALELTNAFKRFAPDDPVRYDFALTRLGMRGQKDLDSFFAEISALGSHADT